MLPVLTLYENDLYFKEIEVNFSYLRKIFFQGENKQIGSKVVQHTM